MPHLVETIVSPVNDLKNQIAQNNLPPLAAMSATEKDAKCLRVLFQMYEQISKDWALTPTNISMIYESFSKYFRCLVSFSSCNNAPSMLLGLDRNTG
jgi:hypothetical protein